MSFYGANFIYDGTISSEFGLRISSSSGTEETSGANVKLFTQEIYRRPKLALLGVQQTPVLELPITMMARTEISAEEDSVISKWLFGSMDYKKLQIIQPDMQYLYFNCIMRNKQTIRVGNIIRGYTATITCDSPFAWEYPKTLEYSYDPDAYTIVDEITIQNLSDNADYTYPSITFKMNAFGGSLSITNTEDDSHVFEMTGLLPLEEITVDNDLQIVTSSLSSVSRLANLTDYNWLRYVGGTNTLSVTGNISSLSFTHQFARKIS